MKKVIYTILIALLLVALGVIVLKIVPGMKEKDPITAQRFASIMKSEGYDVTNVAENLGESSVIKDAVVAMYEDGGYQLEFFEFADSDTAEAFYRQNKSDFEADTKDKVTTSSTFSGKNYIEYTLNAGDEVMKITQIDNTALYIRATKEYKKGIELIVDKLGY